MQDFRELSRDVRGRLERIGNGLARLVQHREDDFLALGSGLQEVAMRVRGITDDSEALHNITAGDTVRDILGKFVAELDSMQTICRVDEDVADTSMLADARRLVEEISKSIRDYARVVRTLQMLGISTRIESARLGADGRGFSTLADDVEKLGYKIVEYSDRITQQARELDELAARAEGSTREMHALQNECAVSVFGSIRENMDTLQELAVNSRHASEEVRGHATSIAESVGRIIGSLQFHDIVRQQVEHIEEALADARSGFVDVKAKGDEELGVELAVAGDICALQKAQLDHARESFTGAVRTLRHELSAIAVSVRAMGQQAGGHADAACLGAGCGGSAELDNMERSVEDIARRMLSLAGQGEGMGRVMNEVADMVARMSEFLEDIEDVGDEIELIALNASIRAAHTGEKGKALGVLASSIQRLSQDAGESTQALARLLREVDGVAGNLKSHATTYPDSAQVAQVSEQLESLTRDLRQVNSESGRLFSAVGSSCTALAAQIEQTVEGLAFDEEVLAGLSDAATAVADLSGTLREMVPPAARAKAARRLSVLRDRYTMEQERVLHGRVLGGEHAATPETAPANDGYGDNVELF